MHASYTKTIILLLAAVPLLAGERSPSRALTAATRAKIERYALEKRYDEHERPALVSAVEAMAQTLAPRDVIANCHAPLKVLEGGRRFPAILFANPVCGECDRVIGLFKALRQDANTSAPSLYVGEVASSEESSQEAVVLLRAISDETARIALLQELLARQPTKVAEVREMARAYAPSVVEQRERGQLKVDGSCPNVGSPLVTYRGRVLQRTRAAGVTFDPLRNDASLVIALDAVDDVTGPDDATSESPPICGDNSLRRAVRVIDAACSPLACDPAKLQALDEIDRASLLTALRNPYLMPVHIFFPATKTRLTDAFDWQSIKEEQLKTIKFLAAPDSTIVFVIGGTSGAGDSTEHRQIARARTHSVYYYLKDVVGVRSRYIKGGWLPARTLQLSSKDATFLGITQSDYRGDVAVLNQAVHVFIYPCVERQASER